MTSSRWTAIAAIAVVLATRGHAQVASPPEGAEDVYLTTPAALREIFHDSERVETAALEFHGDDKSRIEKRLGTRLFEDRFDVYRGTRGDGTTDGYAIVTEEIGKFQPITFIVGVTPAATVKDVAVMVYRESRGGDIKQRRFLSQFVGKTTSDKIRLNADVINVSGATLSARSIARGVKKVLHTVDECVIGPHHRTDLDWRAVVGANGTRKSSAASPVRRLHYVMGTTLEAVGYGDEAVVAKAFDAAFAEVARLDTLLSDYQADSEISLVNRDAVAKAVVVSPETIECVEDALRFARASNGAFDPTLTADGWRDVEIDHAARSIRFHRDGLRLDLGGIGKGFALDRVASILDAHGVSRARLDFGGQVLALDPPPGESSWIIGVADPERDDQTLGFFAVTRASVSTSSTSERGEHIVDPHGGATPRTARFVTVCAPRGTDADALSTALFVLGANNGKTLVASSTGVTAVIASTETSNAACLTGSRSPAFVRTSSPRAAATPMRR